MSSRTIAVPYGPSRTVVYHADFLSYRATQGVLNLGVERPSPLSVEQHAAHRRKMENILYIKRKYAAETEINVTVNWEIEAVCCSHLLAPFPHPANSFDLRTVSR